MSKRRKPARKKKAEQVQAGAEVTTADSAEDADQEMTGFGPNTEKGEPKSEENPEEGTVEEEKTAPAAEEILDAEIEFGITEGSAPKEQESLEEDAESEDTSETAAEDMPGIVMPEEQEEESPEPKEDAVEAEEERENAEPDQEDEDAEEYEIELDEPPTKQELMQTAASHKKLVALYVIFMLYFLTVIILSSNRVIGQKATICLGLVPLAICGVVFVLLRDK